MNYGISYCLMLLYAKEHIQQHETISHGSTTVKITSNWEHCKCNNVKCLILTILSTLMHLYWDHLGKATDFQNVFLCWYGYGILKLPHIQTQHLSAYHFSSSMFSTQQSVSCSSGMLSTKMSWCFATSDMDLTNPVDIIMA